MTNKKRDPTPFHPPYNAISTFNHTSKQQVGSPLVDGTGKGKEPIGKVIVLATHLHYAIIKWEGGQ